MKFKNIFFTAPLVFFLGCSHREEPKFVDLSLKYITTDSAPEVSVDSKAQAQLSETAQAVNQSLQQLSAIQLATHPDVDIQEPMHPDVTDMNQPTSLDWTGPVEPLLQKIATASHYQLRVLGTKPAIPVIVSIQAEDEPLSNILRDTTYQVANKARIKIYPESKTIELRYLSDG